MKANEAPEKIYLNQDDGLIQHCRSYKDDIEYTRTDAFIEKAKNWLYLQLNEVNMEGEDMENFLEDFKTYMKGE